MTNELADPPELGLIEYQLVLVLYEEQTRQPLHYGCVHPGSHLSDFFFEAPLLFLEQRDGLGRREGRDKGKPGSELRVLFHRLAKELAKPAEELGAPFLGQPVNGALRTPALPSRL